MFPVCCFPGLFAERPTAINNRSHVAATKILVGLSEFAIRQSLKTPAIDVFAMVMDVLARTANARCLGYTVRQKTKPNYVASTAK